MCGASGGRETATQATSLELYKGLCVSFFSYFLASSLESSGSQKPNCICTFNSPYHHRTDALVCVLAINYRNQFVVLGSFWFGFFLSLYYFFIPLLWRGPQTLSW